MVTPGDAEVDDLLDVLEYIRARWNPSYLAQAGVGKRIPWEQKRDYALALARAVDLAISHGDMAAAKPAAPAGGAGPVPHHHPGVGLGLARSAGSQTAALGLAGSQVQPPPPPQQQPQQPQLQLPGGLSITLPPQFGQLDPAQQQQLLGLLLQQQQQQQQQLLLLQQQQQQAAQAQAHARAAALQAALPPGLTPAQQQQLLQYLAQQGSRGLPASFPFPPSAAAASLQLASQTAGGIPIPMAMATAGPAGQGQGPSPAIGAIDTRAAATGSLSPVPNILEASSLLLKTAATAAQQEAATSIAMLAAPPFKPPKDAEAEYSIFLSATERAQAQAVAAATVGVKAGALAAAAAPVEGPCRFQDDPQWYFVHCALPWSNKVGVTVEGASIPVGGRVRPVLLVTEVAPGGAGEGAGVRVGDCVVKVEGRDASAMGCGELMSQLKELLRARQAVDPSMTLDFVMARSLPVRLLGWIVWVVVDWWVVVVVVEETD